jgi:hypothetical protein
MMNINPKAPAKACAGRRQFGLVFLVLDSKLTEAGERLEVSSHCCQCFDAFVSVHWERPLMTTFVSETLGAGAADRPSGSRRWQVLSMLSTRSPKGVSELDINVTASVDLLLRRQLPR